MSLSHLSTLKRHRPGPRSKLQRREEKANGATQDDQTTVSLAGFEPRALNYSLKHGGVYQHYVGASEAAVIEFLTAENVSPKEIHWRLKAVYHDQCVDISTVRRWSARARNEPGASLNLCDKGRSETTYCS
ncbi:hypothetical protein ANN_13112 [Periplaneta americana]|uniref:Mos1 transposase HTH domain-containing protein n=1 Tax=Periplaneta americana TaxID=6978 RepID=A0ABQ8TKH5_PERAM|nr:hypothetical protein ANN_13112 [Periplaneta americana]